MLVAALRFFEQVKQCARSTKSARLSARWVENARKLVAFTGRESYVLLHYDDIASVGSRNGILQSKNNRISGWSKMVALFS